MKYSWKRFGLMFTGISILCLLVAANGESSPQSKAQAGQSVQDKPQMAENVFKNVQNARPLVAPHFGRVLVCGNLVAKLDGELVAQLEQYREYLQSDRDYVSSFLGSFKRTIAGE